MTIKYVIIGIIIATLMISGIASAFAGGPRLDSPEDSTREGGVCWIDGYDSGFAGKYDKDRADVMTSDKFLNTTFWLTREPNPAVQDNITYAVQLDDDPDRGETGFDYSVQIKRDPV